MCEKGRLAKLVKLGEPALCYCKFGSTIIYATVETRS